MGVSTLFLSRFIIFIPFRIRPLLKILRRFPLYNFARAPTFLALYPADERLSRLRSSVVFLGPSNSSFIKSCYPATLCASILSYRRCPSMNHKIKTKHTDSAPQSLCRSLPMWPLMRPAEALLCISEAGQLGQ